MNHVPLIESNILIVFFIQIKYQYFTSLIILIAVKLFFSQDFKPNAPYSLLVTQNVKLYSDLLINRHRVKTECRL